MNDKVWAGTATGSTFHAFPEGKGLCNARIRPYLRHLNAESNHKDYRTMDEVKALGAEDRVCERCAFRMAHLARKAEAEANPIQALTPEDAQALADDKGRVLFEGNANTHKKPQGFPEPVTIEREGRVWVLRSEDGTERLRVRGTTKLYVRRCPEGYDDMRAQARAEAEALAESFTMVEVAAPIEAAERKAEDTGVVSADVTAASVDAWVKREFPALAQLDADQDQGANEYPNVAHGDLDDVEVSAQDIADAALASGECEWTDEQVADAAQAGARVVEAAEALTKEAAQGARYAVGQTVDYTRGGDVPAGIPNGRVEVTRVVDHGPEAAYREGGRFTYVVRIPGVPQATQGASEDELTAIEGAPQLDAHAVTQEQAEAAREADARGVRAEAKAREAAALRLEALRGPEVEADVPFVGVHRNVSYMITMAPNEKARASWKRVSLASYFAHHVKAHAQANSGNGWDVIVEGWTDGELNVLMLEGNPQSTEEAIAYARTMVVDPYREREADALISAWGF
ncbi:hypothetical protein [Streptomyces sp. NPDC026659]|uniref:hypothetical protein n=1 Tax=Streptomyces sp. NPDC026659 TaxID=3155123 RepID=UPI0033ED98E3